MTQILIAGHPQSALGSALALAIAHRAMEKDVDVIVMEDTPERALTDVEPFIIEALPRVPFPVHIKDLEPATPFESLQRNHKKYRRR